MENTGHTYTEAEDECEWCGERDCGHCETCGEGRYDHRHAVAS